MSNHAKTPAMVILVRLGAELITKSQAVRSRFQKRLIHNMRAALQREAIPARIVNAWSRLFVETNDPRAIMVIRTIFGISSYSVIENSCATDLETIVRMGKSWYEEAVQGKSFAVRCHRSGNIGFRSIDVNQQLGAALRPASARVNLKNPDVPIYVEARPDQTHFFRNVIQGAGGFPLGVGGRAVCLMSGGFDSPVAAWMMMGRGLAQELVFCSIAGKVYEQSVLRVSKMLMEQWSHGALARLHIVDFSELVEQLRQEVTAKNVQVILKRLFLRAAEGVAEDVGAQAIVTGESVGQVSSQTVANLKAIEDATLLPVLRPVVGMDKNQIINLSKRVGTFELSSSIQEYCQLVPDRPNTNCSVREAQAEEARLNLDVLHEAVKSRRIVDLRKLSDRDLAGEGVTIDHIPANCQFLDCRDAESYARWHAPGAERIDFVELGERIGTFDKHVTYILYCPFGMQSAVMAERLQSKGFEAYSFAGGTEALRRLLTS